MGILLVILFLALSIWVLAALFRKLLAYRASRGWWGAFGLLVVCGLLLGIWCGLFFEYHAGTNYRVGGFPIPIVVFHLEDGNWVDFPVPEFQAWLAVIANAISIAALATLPLWLASWQRHGRKN